MTNNKDAWQCKPAACPRSQVADDGLSLALRTLGFFPQDTSTQSTDQDAVLVAIDFENTSAFNTNLAQNANTQVGIAILDTRNIGRAVPPETLISTYNFVTGSPKYYRNAMLKFLFGKPILINTTDILNKIQDHIPKGRNIFLVGHDIDNETRILEILGFHFQQHCVSACLDTFRIGSQVLPYRSFTLGELLTHLECPHNWLHNGGNDANFTLRALLLLAAENCNTQETNHNRARLLEEAARYPIPCRSPGEEELRARASAATHEIRAEKKMKRFKNTRKYQSRLWSDEKKEEIRAQRAAKRLARERSVPVAQQNDEVPARRSPTPTLGG